MEIKALIGQRHNSYPGEHAPEIIEAIDEFTDDQNPEWLIRKEREARETEGFHRLVIVTANIPDEDIQKALYPEVRINTTSKEGGDDEEEMLSALKEAVAELQCGCDPEEDPCEYHEVIAKAEGRGVSMS